MLKRFLCRHFAPSQVLDSVSCISLDDLKSQGIKGLILDLDDTLVALGTNNISPECSEWLNNALKEFNLHLVTNNSNPTRVKTFQQTFNIEAFMRAGKPRKKFILLAIEKMNLEPFEVVMIGDRLLTDVFAGNRTGTKTILVKPIGRSNLFFRIIRKMEQNIIDFIK